MEEDFKKDDFDIVGPDPILDQLMILGELYLKRYEDYRRRRVDIGRGGMATQFYAYSDMEEEEVSVEKESKRWRGNFSFNNDIIRVENLLFSGKYTAKESGFLKLIEKHNLTEDEAVVMAILIWDKLNGYFNTYKGNLNHLEILFIMYLDLCEAIRNLDLFEEDKALVSENLIEVVAFRRNPFRDKYGVYYSPTERVMVALLGEYGSEFSLADRTDNGKRSRTGYGNSLNTYNPRVNLDDVVLPEETEDAVMEALAIVEQKELIYDEWGIDRVIEKGKGTILLFYGPPGTGKTMTAEALASYLNKEVCSINIAQIENCFVGVTEKNIEEVFKRAKEEDLFLLLDECDSLISSRSEGSRSINKYYNRVVNLLLKEIEEFEGVLVMTTNRSDFLDEALDRRVALKVMFNMPGYEERLRIWKRFLSLENAVSEVVDVERLAKEYKLSGGEIKNAFIAGARIGARRVNDDGGERLITMSDLLKGCKMAKEGAGVQNEKKLGF